jgi:TRAP-type C4-dicarboxylate transport system permease large subunit
MDLAPMLFDLHADIPAGDQDLGIDPVHFGIIMILNLGIGLLDTAVGPTMVAIGCAIGKVSMEAALKVLSSSTFQWSSCSC